MKKSITFSCILLFAALFATSATQGGLIRFVWSGGGAGDGVDFADAGNWGGEAATGSNLPGDVVDSGAADTSNVILQTGGTSTTSITAPFTPANPFDILIVRSGHTLDLSADVDLTGIPTWIGQTGTGSTINQTAGTFTTANLTLGDVGQPGTGTYNLSGTGSLSATAVNVVQNSIVGVTGSAANFSATSLTIESGSMLDFTFGPAGVTPVGLSGAFNVTSGALLGVDGSAFTGSAGSYDLVTFGGNTGTFADPADVTISGFAGYNAAVGYDSTRMFVTLSTIPEPSSLSLLGVGATALLLLQRRIK
jgi:hypothetical protein